MSKFGLICQAASLLGQALQYASIESEANDDGWVQLDRTMQSMLNASLEIDEFDYDYIAFVYRWVCPISSSKERENNFGDNIVLCWLCMPLACPLIKMTIAPDEQKRLPFRCLTS